MTIHLASLMPRFAATLRHARATVQAHVPAEELDVALEHVVQQMNTVTPYTPVLSRWYGLAYWLVRLAPLAALVDELCEGESKRSEAPHVDLLAVIARTCMPHGIADQGVVRRARSYKQVSAMTTRR